MGELTIGGRSGDFDGMLKERTFNIIWITHDRPLGFDPAIAPDSSVVYNGQQIVIKRNL